MKGSASETAATGGGNEPHFPLWVTAIQLTTTCTKKVRTSPRPVTPMRRANVSPGVANISAMKGMMWT